MYVFVMRCAWSSSLENQSWRKKAGDANLVCPSCICYWRPSSHAHRRPGCRPARPDLTCVGVLLVMQKGPPGPRGTDAQPRPRRLGGASVSIHSQRSGPNTPTSFPFPASPQRIVALSLSSIEAGLTSSTLFHHTPSLQPSISLFLPQHHQRRIPRLAPRTSHLSASTRIPRCPLVLDALLLLKPRL